MFDRLETYIAELQTDPVGFLITMAYTWGVILFSLILHECAHGYVALRCGDPTAKMLGRLSLNPARHLDPIGTLSMFLFGFGWAKPVPVNPRNFRHYVRDDLLVSLAGVTVNLSIFVFSVLLSCIVNRFLMGADTIKLLCSYYTTGVESFLSPLYWDGLYIMNGEWESLAAELPVAYGVVDGAVQKLQGMALVKHYFAVPWLLWVQRLLLTLGQVNLTLAIFNLFPIPPLDGFHVVNDLLLKGRLNLNRKLFSIAQVILIALVVTGVLNELLYTATSMLYTAVLRTFLTLTGQGV